MCGIFGYAGNVSKNKLLHEFVVSLAAESEARGVDSAGFAARYDSGHIVVDKMPYRASIFTQLSHKFNRMSSKMPSTFIGHTRLGTGSSPSINNNNHPFIGVEFHMVHNGVIPSWRDVVTKHQLAMHSETDSEVILRILEKKRQDMNLNKSVEWVLNNVWGNMAVALLDKITPDIWLFRNENPINVFIPSVKIFDGKILFFCSTKKIFDDAWKRTFESSPTENDVSAHFLDDNHLYKISTKGTSINGKIERFIFHRLNVKQKFQPKKQYYGGTVGTQNISSRWSTVGATSSFYSDIVDKDNLIMKFKKKDADNLRNILNQRNGKNKIKIDGMHISQYTALRRFNVRLAKIGESLECKKEIKGDEAKEEDKISCTEAGVEIHEDWKSRFVEKNRSFCN